MRSKPYIDANPHEPTDADWDRMCERGIRLDIGCGENPRPNHFGIDRMWGCEAFPLTWADGTLLLDSIATDIVASHILEHFSVRDVPAVLREWVRVLKPGGTLAVSVPDFDWICKHYIAGNPDEEPLFSYLLGGQKDHNDYHKSVFNFQILERLMMNAGLSDICRWRSDWADCSSLELSLNLRGMK